MAALVPAVPPATTRTSTSCEISGCEALGTLATFSSVAEAIRASKALARPKAAVWRMNRRQFYIGILACLLSFSRSSRLFEVEAGAGFLEFGVHSPVPPLHQNTPKALDGFGVLPLVVGTLDPVLQQFAVPL